MKESSYTESQAYSIINPLIEKAGFSLISLDSSGTKNSCRYSLVVHSPKGLSLDDCVMLHKIILPRMEVSFPGVDVYIDIMSPGVGRVIKSASEFAHFVGLCCKVLLEKEENWIEGTIVKSGEGLLSLSVKEEGQESLREIPFEDIKKAKLL